MQLARINKGFQKFVGSVYIQSIQAAFYGAMPFIIVGSLFLLLGSLPINGYTNWLTGIVGKTGLNALNTGYSVCMGMMTLYIIIYMANMICQFKGIDRLLGISVSLATFLLASPIKINDGVSYLDLTSFSSAGMFTSFFTTIFSLKILELIVKHQNPKSMSAIPDNVRKAFTALVPIFVIVAIFIAINYFFAATEFKTLYGFFSTIIQKPFTHFAGSLPMMMLFTLIEALLWVMGVHGSNIVLSVTQPVLLALADENLKHGAHNIINIQFYSHYMKLGGFGATIGLCLLCLFWAKSERYKSIGKLGIIPGIFNINEPMIFGLPVILNPIFAIPFVITPLVMCLVAYFATYIGLVPVTNGVVIPWNTPIIISGFLISGWQGAVLNVVQVIICIAIGYPFFKKADNQAYAEEQAKKQAAETKEEPTA
ncbi:PTS sugar transporter subunit IIC [Loigolactobacillus bifermentans]|uniref:Permease IIC component n=1 Tax=Loigolactobacillus bifermentans DSM 20003 TaxID=1423726 RepID=A0A0R1GKG4_9LACO|nr:PTS transporter subunit EIIC [Loigolactobacillus bifermentans]KRK34588.1 phosphotransferase system enzyme IIC permease component [Loigolactobacillus bifermentans DSM 20003]QGG61140.1 oligo-beta-mannoside permease IIC protein [Loigolactobacillus bifermentans]